MYGVIVLIEYILYFAVIFLAMLGLSELLHLAKRFFLSCGISGESYHLLILRDENAYGELYSAIDEHSWYGESHSKKIIAVFFESEEWLTPCYELALEKGITLCSIDELCEVLKEIAK